MIHKDRPVTDWINGDHVVINQRLASHYGMNKTAKDLTDDDQFKAILISDDPRAGVRSGAFGLGAVHMLTSYSRRTSPVLRGGWVLETMFGTRVPAPPPDVPVLPGGERESDKQTVRQRLEKHRKHPTCAACHDLIDPIGFAMENFDVLGRWRDKEGKEGQGPKIDSSGKLPSGETFSDINELRGLLANRKEDFVHQYVKQMLGYALGRSLEEADICTIETVARNLNQSGNRTGELISSIVTSLPFTHRDKVRPNQAAGSID